MALINCSECAQELSDKAASCPKCGAPIEVAKENTPKSNLAESVETKNINIWMFLASVMFPFITPLIYQFTKAEKRKKIQSWACSVGFMAFIMIAGEQGRSVPSVAAVSQFSADQSLSSWAGAQKKDKERLCAVMVKKIEINVASTDLCACIGQAAKEGGVNITIAETAASCAVILINT